MRLARNRQPRRTRSGFGPCAGPPAAKQQGFHWTPPSTASSSHRCVVHLPTTRQPEYHLGALGGDGRRRLAQPAPSPDPIQRKDAHVTQDHRPPGSARRKAASPTSKTGPAKAQPSKAKAGRRRRPPPPPRPRPRHPRRRRGTAEAPSAKPAPASKTAAASKSATRSAAKATKTAAKATRTAARPRRRAARDTARIAAAEAAAETAEGTVRLEAGLEVAGVASQAAAAGTSVDHPGRERPDRRGRRDRHRRARRGARRRRRGRRDQRCRAGRRARRHVRGHRDHRAPSSARSARDDLDRGLEIARRQRRARGARGRRRPDRHARPGGFLSDRGEQLMEVSVEAIVRAGGTRAIARPSPRPGSASRASVSTRRPRALPGSSLPTACRSRPGHRRGRCRAQLPGLRGDGRRRGRPPRRRSSSGRPASPRPPRAAPSSGSRGARRDRRRPRTRRQRPQKPRRDRALTTPARPDPRDPTAATGARRYTRPRWICTSSARSPRRPSAPRSTPSSDRPSRAGSVARADSGDRWPRGPRRPRRPRPPRPAAAGAPRRPVADRLDQPAGTQLHLQAAGRRRRPRPTASPRSTPCSRRPPRPPVVAHVCDDIACRLAGAEDVCADLTRARRARPASRHATAGRRGSASPCLGLCDLRPGGAGDRRGRDADALQPRARPTRPASSPGSRAGRAARAGRERRLPQAEPIGRDCVSWRASASSTRSRSTPTGPRRLRGPDPGPRASAPRRHRRGHRRRS